jgi:hypothetical protein
VRRLNGEASADMTFEGKLARALESDDMKHTWSEIDSQLLVRIVKQCQKKESSGEHGDWKTFLKASRPLMV